MITHKSTRLKHYDYRTPGFYFITVCTFRKQHTLGDISNGNFIGNELAHVVERCWKAIPDCYPNSRIDTSVIMPNHFHGLLQLLPGDDWSPGKHPLGKIVNAFKGAVTRQFREKEGDPALTIWQRGYFEHVVRDEIGVERVRDYIKNNPRIWDMDRENSSRSISDPFDVWLEEHHSRP